MVHRPELNPQRLDHESNMLAYLLLKIVIRCRRTLRGEGHSAAGWGMGGSVTAADCGSKVRTSGQWAVAICAAPPSVIAGQYATLNCKTLVIKCK